MNEPSESDSEASEFAAPPGGSYVQRMAISYAWLILKNIIGWILIIISWPVGVAFPGPGGLPLFIIGFALVSFPGKRKLTARALSGKSVPPDSRAFTIGMTIFATVTPALAIVWLSYWKYIDAWSNWQRVGFFITVYIGLLLVLVPVGLHSKHVLNWFLRFFASTRRKVRPWLRSKGVDLLPPRRRRRRDLEGISTRAPDHEILQIHDRHFLRVHRLWGWTKRWGKRAGTIAVVGAIFFYMFRQIVMHWDIVVTEIRQIHPWRFLVAIAMFALFLAFRALSWRRILIGFGHRLPLAPATRIWSTSELARYLPGTIWQVLGRMYLVRPYGVRGSVSSTSQILELTTFLLANVIIASLCLLWFVAKLNPQARGYVFVAMALVPVLGVLLHPRIFYGITNKVMRWRNKPPITERLSGFALVRLLLRLIVAILWQNAAVFLLLQPVLGLKVDHWWTVAGAYSLAWCAGFLGGFLTPAGLGVREVVFMATMELVLRGTTHDVITQSTPVLFMLALILRAWTITGELIVAIIAYLIDYRGALGRPDAPGRTAPQPNNAAAWANCQLSDAPVLSESVAACPEVGHPDLNKESK